MQLPIKNLFLMALMVATATVAWAMRPTIFLANLRPKVDLEQLVPRQFGAWRELQQSTGQIVNPQQTELLQKLYSQTLSRTYVNEEGAIVMLSIAYGANQSDGVALHYPEVCYPAQGFQVLSNEKGTLDTGFGAISVKHLMTKLGNRSEPVTYWSTIGDKVVQSGLNTKLTQLDYGFKGQIPDGLIFRISSISSDAQQGYAQQNSFVKAFVKELSPNSRLRLVGLSS